MPSFSQEMPAFIFKKIKNGDEQIFNFSVDLPNEFSNGIKIRLKYDQ